MSIPVTLKRLLLLVYLIGYLLYHFLVAASVILLFHLLFYSTITKKTCDLGLIAFLLLEQTYGKLNLCDYYKNSY